MDKITVECCFEDQEGKRFLCLKVLDQAWQNSRQPVLFGEISESLLGTSHDNICIDLSGLRIVNSAAFGACMNIANAARDRGKNLKLRLSKSAAETARIARLDALATVEECGGEAGEK